MPLGVSSLNKIFFHCNANGRKHSMSLVVSKDIYNVEK